MMPTPVPPLDAKHRAAFQCENHSLQNSRGSQVSQYTSETIELNVCKRCGRTFIPHPTLDIAHTCRSCVRDAKSRNKKDTYMYILPTQQTISTIASQQLSLSGPELAAFHEVVNIFKDLSQTAADNLNKSSTSDVGNCNKGPEGTLKIEGNEGCQCAVCGGDPCFCHRRCISVFTQRGKTITSSDGVVLKHQYGNVCPDCRMWRHRLQALNLSSNNRVFMKMKLQLPTACRAYCVTNSDLGFKVEDVLCKAEFSMTTRGLLEDSLISLTLVSKRAAKNFERYNSCTSEDVYLMDFNEKTSTPEDVQFTDLDEIPCYCYDSEYGDD